jgi:peptidylprolyl isomerase
MKQITPVSLLALGLLAFAIAPALAADAGKPVVKKSPEEATGGKLIKKDTKVGTGPAAKAGDSVTVHYTGWLFENGKKGKQFDSSVGKDPFVFPLGAGRVIQGWDQGVEGMKKGGKRTLTIPPELGYGASGAGGVIPPNATLLFDVELLDIASK